MTFNYDMCVDYDTLCEIDGGLDRIVSDLNYSTEQMIRALRESQDFLEGNQFEKAKKQTTECLEVTRKAGGNAINAKKFISELKACLEEYSRCTYNGV